jgi:glycosyltransferase involved in cell wall biosynthesis
MAYKLPLSVSIITYNEESNIGRTVESVSDIASEIVIVDSNSTDNTPEIARIYGAKLYTEEWKGFAEQKNSCLKKCTQDWILCLDADELVSDELKNSIINEISNPQANGYQIKRQTFYLGKLLKYAWQPDLNLRLVQKTSNPLWIGNIVHESLQIEGQIKKLNGTLIHFSYNNLKHHFNKTVEYARISAQSYSELGKNFHFYNLIINPILAWFRLYIINKGFLDGTRGFIAAASSFVYTFLKYAFLFENDLKKN